jgi:hypothetical protein
VSRVIRRRNDLIHDPFGDEALAKALASGNVAEAVRSVNAFSDELDEVLAMVASPAFEASERFLGASSEQLASAVLGLNANELTDDESMRRQIVVLKEVLPLLTAARPSSGHESA